MGFDNILWGQGRGSPDPIFFLHESSSWVKIGLHAKNQLPGWSGSGVKDCRGGGGVELS